MTANSTLVDAAEAVKDAINAQTFSKEFDAVRAYAPVEDPENLKDVQVFVIPAGAKRIRATRRTDNIDPLIHIAVQYKLQAQDLEASGTIKNSEVDEFMVLVEEISDYLRGSPIEGYSGGHSIGIANDPIWWPEQLKNPRVFTSVISLTLRVFKDNAR